MTHPNPYVEHMYNNDPFSQWLGIKRIEDGEGISTLEMTVRPEMCNGFGIAHGGISFSLADSALAFASNSYGRMAVSIECSIHHLKAINVGDVLRTMVTEKMRQHKLALYQIDVHNQDNDLVASFEGLVYRKSEGWDAIISS